MTGTPMEALETVLRERLAGTLPGLDAQLRFMPTPPRSGWKPGEFPTDARLAAGLLLLYPGERGPSIPLTVRASGLRRHAGQISLPGGAMDPGETLTQAAMREAHEEIGVEPARVRVLGELTPVHVLVSGFTLHPIVGITDRRPSFTLAAHEVEEVIEVSVEDLQDASAIRQGTRTREGVAIEYPYFDLMGHQVWGATAMILGEFICVLRQGDE
jgi:8-oxo-dGTP pyrophosphatase MutT (NUDIX family)